MQLQYRGNTYHSDYATIEAPKLPVFGTYRGQRTSFSEPQPGHSITEELTYRGISYMPCKPRPGERILGSRQALQILRKRSYRHPAFRG